MAADNTAKRGNYICKVGFYDIYCKFSFEGEGKKRKVKSHSLDIYHSKKLVKNGFKTKVEAIKYINTL
jgi:hypothetical protein